MYIKKLRLYNYRNLNDCEVEFAPGINFFVGKNGQGKTNLVESLSFLSHTKSFRTTKIKELIRWGTAECSVFGTLQREDGEYEIGVSIEGKTKRVYINGETVRKLSDYVGQLLCVSFSPTDLSLVKGAPGERRRFVDRHLVELNPKLLDQFVTYSRALKNKAALLKEGVTDEKQYESWNHLLAETAHVIEKERLKFIATLELAAREYYQHFSSVDGELSLALESKLVEGSATPSKEEIIALLNEALQREIRQRKVVLGPHRDDLRINLGEIDSRAYASQGQTRSIVLALKLGVLALLEEHTGEAPVVLLDDVDSELDSERRRSLFELVSKVERQIFITGTEIRERGVLFENENNHFVIENGTILRPK